MLETVLKLTPLAADVDVEPGRERRRSTTKREVAIGTRLHANCQQLAACPIAEVNEADVGEVRTV